MNRISYLLLALLLFLLPEFVHAADGIAVPMQLNFQEPATPVMERLAGLSHYLHILITVICVFVLVLLIYIVFRFNVKSNPVPSKTTHNTLLEIAWTTVPILILVAIAIPSLKLHYYMDRSEKADMTLKVIGRQWYWEYEYPDHGVTFESRLIPDKDIKPELGQHRLLSVDNPVVVPVNAVVRVLVTGGDVLHSWAMPSFGIKTDAIPGRLNETWFQATRVGNFYGQCSELCGVDHGFMPIHIRVVSLEEFAGWVTGQGGKMPAAANDNMPSAPAPQASATVKEKPHT